MKKYIHKKAVIAAVTILGVIGCTEFTEKIEDFNIGVTNAIFEQTAVIELTEVFGNQQDIIDTDFTVVFSGADADKLVSEAGEFEIKENDGFIQLSVNPNKSTGVKELNFNVTISGGDYRKQTYPITLKDTVSYITLDLEKVYVPTPIADYSDKKESTNSLNGNTNTNSIIVATTRSKSISKSSIEIKANTIFKDENNNPISGNSLNIELIDISTIGQEDIPNDIKVFKDENGIEITDKEVLLSNITSINMNVDNVAVKKFDNAIEVAIELPNTTLNPITGAKLKAGDKLPIYTNEDNENDWTYQGEGIVEVSNTAGYFNIKFNTTHLSNFAIVSYNQIYPECDNRTLNMDYNSINNLNVEDGSYMVMLEQNIVAKKSNNSNIFIYILQSKGNNYERGIQYMNKTFTDKNGVEYYYIKRLIVFDRIDVKNGVGQIKSRGLLNGENTYFTSPSLSSGNYSKKLRKTIIDPNYKPSNNYKYVLSEFSDPQDLIDNGLETIGDFTTLASKISLYSREISNNYTISHSLISNNNQVSVVDCNILVDLSSANYTKPDNLKDINIDVSGSCNGNTIVPDGFPLYYNVNGSYKYAGTIKNGKMTLRGFELNKEYEFKTVFQGQSYVNKWTFTSTNFKVDNYAIPQSVCDEIGL
ncbi:hypothetical protein GCM10011416_01430 [Polaribacter pacificus]|uniref:Lipoprotein n=1 Tax=Polaribacter pacificus TaxID=1775173 RepID=A0A917HTK4_9FLAO|nr:hypothetical protein [Polaribacter pacificus]GGG88800.1 hypothetical protein GCM10011416_01430 [Polaribacter pacificus]